MATTPTISRTTAALMYSNSSVPTRMPRSDAGSRMRSSGQIHLPRNFHSATRSITHRIGSRIAAACTGEMTRAINGTAATPRPPPNPPFEMPNIRTAGTATT